MSAGIGDLRRDLQYVAELARTAGALVSQPQPWCSTPESLAALLQERFVPVYFMHRFAIASVAKAVGGMEYSNAVRGDGQQATRVVPAADQRAALRELGALLEPAQLAIPTSQ